MKKQLALKGHKTRGKEVIEILQMLGGRKTVYGGTDTLCIYFLNDFGEITSELYRDSALTSLTYDVYTLEEFIEKYPYKIGDKVYLDNKLCSIIWMCWECNNIYYTVQGIDDMFTKKVVADELKPYKEEVNMKDNKLFGTVSLKDDKDPLHELCENMCENKLSMLMINSEVCGDEVELILDDYEIKVRDGKTYAVKKKPKYPTTYKECCITLGIDPDNYITIRNSYCDDGEETITDYEDTLKDNFDNLWELIICRDAYRKIYSEQMGLDKSWEPNYISLVNNEYFTIHTFNNEITKSGTSHRNAILSFPTEELRDIFFENFKDLIEHCKKLL